MKVKYVLTATIVKEVDMKDFHQAEDEDDASEQLLAQYQDQPEDLIEEAKEGGLITVVGQALRVS